MQSAMRNIWYSFATNILDGTYSDTSHKRIFLAIPMISTMTYLPAILTSRSAQAKLVSFLNMTSLLATAYILVFISSKKPDRVRAKRSLTHFQDEPGPMNRYLPYLNGGFSFLLALNAIIWRDRNGVHEGFWLLCLLPAGILHTVFSSIKADDWISSFLGHHASEEDHARG